jgi:nucleotide-binding universal stress UspA family protein
MANVFTRILLATEHSEHDVGAELLAFALARRCALPLAAVLPIVSNPEYEALAPQLAAHAEAQAGERMRSLADEAQRAGVELELQARRGPEPYREIVDEAAARRADLIVIRRRGKRGLLANLLLGEMVRNVVTHAPCSVLVVPRAAQMWSQRVLVATDPLTADMTPVATAAAIAAECGLPLTVICVTEPAADAMEKAEKALQKAWSTARAFDVPTDALVRIGRPHEQIIAAAQQLGADLLVIGRHGDDSMPRAWLGGIAQKVIGLADRPVLVSASGPATPASKP